MNMRQGRRQRLAFDASQASFEVGLEPVHGVEEVLERNASFVHLLLFSRVVCSCVVPRSTASKVVKIETK